MIKFLDLQKTNATYQEQFHKKLELVLENGWFILGSEVKTFEMNFAAYTKSRHCIGVANGLDALVLIFMGHMELGNLQKGDEVIVPANTYIASILAILQTGLVPVLVEPDVQTFNLNPDLIAEKITSQTKAIMAVHLYGQLADMEALTAIAKAHNLILVEDAAQGHGLPFKGNHTKGFSFYPGKNLGALGDAGAITTDDDDLAKVLFSLRNYGSEKKYHNQFIGINSRLDELQAAFLNVKLPFLDAENQKRKAIAHRYLTEIKNDKIILPYHDFSDRHVFHLFVIRTANRNQLHEYLKENGIETLIHYPIPPHKQQALKPWNHLSFPITEKIHEEVLSLPIGPLLTSDEVDFVIKILNQYE